MATEDDGWLSYEPKIWAKPPTEFLVGKRLETIPLKMTFHDTMSKAKLETFSHINKKMEFRKGTEARQCSVPTTLVSGRSWWLAEENSKIVIGKGVRKMLRWLHSQNF